MKKLERYVKEIIKFKIYNKKKEVKQSNKTRAKLPKKKKRKNPSFFLNSRPVRRWLVYKRFVLFNKEYNTRIYYDFLTTKMRSFLSIRYLIIGTTICM